jgi:hypothetical protein
MHSVSPILVRLPVVLLVHACIGVDVDVDSLPAT